MKKLVIFAPAYATPPVWHIRAAREYLAGVEYKRRNHVAYIIYAYTHVINGRSRVSRTRDDVIKWLVALAEGLTPSILEEWQSGRLRQS